jgi:multisubunit Na+/H+ antiporter MnhF subunit
MIDTWLAAVLCLALLVSGALFRVNRSRTWYDRLVAAVVAITLAAGAGLFLSITLGNLLVLDVTIIAALTAYIILIALAKFPGRDRE